MGNGGGVWSQQLAAKLSYIATVQGNENLLVGKALHWASRPQARVSSN